MTMLLSLMLAASTTIPTTLTDVPVIEKWQGRRISPRWSEEAKRAYRRGNCSGAKPYEGGDLLELDVLFLVANDGKLVRLAPVNVQCPEVEKFVSGRIMGTLRNSFPRHDGAEPQWYRSQVRFLWSD